MPSSVAELISTPADYLKGRLRPKAKVLLVNPPVQEKRYHWLRWNQPLELLRLSTWLKQQIRSADIRLFDFMFPDEKGDVPRHKVKETWAGPQADALWHFGRPFEEFDHYLDDVVKRGCVPNVIVLTSLTSYWHSAIEKLLLRICNVLGPMHRTQTTIALYGAYRAIEPEHAEGQRSADIAFTVSVDMRGCAPDFRLYLEQWNRAPLYFGLDIDSEDVARLLYDVQFWMETEKRTTFVFVCDEAHLYLPVREDADAVEKQALYSFERIAKEGRKYGVSLLVVSQRPSDVSRTILSQCNNFLILRLTNDQDQNVVRRLMPDSLAGVLDDLPLLDTGEALLLGDAILLPARIKLKFPTIEPLSQTRNFWQEWGEKAPDSAAVAAAVETLRRQSRTAGTLG